MGKEKCGCDCCSGPKLIFACSGAADVGALTDLAARRITRSGEGRMYCLAGLGGDVGPIIETTRSAEAIMAIDGCPTDCVRKCLERTGFTGFIHQRVTDLGLEKGKSAPTEENIAIVEKRCRKLLTQ